MLCKSHKNTFRKYEVSATDIRLLTARSTAVDLAVSNIAITLFLPFS